eukprot:m.207187 g.207187  ORF g.207187 m.207187 type:complete len:551 (+) comp32976_c0_seq1:224-1876(+)
MSLNVFAWLVVVTLTVCTCHANEFSYSMLAQGTSTVKSYLTKGKSITSTTTTRTIPGKSGCRTRITKVGICGDADQSSGSVGFYLSGTDGTAFSFDAGQNSKTRGGLNYRLPPTVRTGPGARYGGYKTFSTEEQKKHTFKTGTPVTVIPLGSNDGDGLRCYEQNPIDGQRIYDSSFSSSYRSLVMFDYDCIQPCTSGLYMKDITDSNSCTKCRVCSNGKEYQTAPCVSTTTTQSNANCSVCSPPPDKESYQAVPCTLAGDALYSPCTACADDEYELKSCSQFTNRLCMPYSPKCDTATQFEAVPATASSNRLCLPRTTCDKGQFLASNGDASTNSLCFQTAPPCLSPIQFETDAPSETSDRKCALTTPCLASEFEDTPPTPTSDRKCLPMQTCIAGEQETAPATATSDRGCEPRSKCFTCEPGTYEVQPCDLTLKIEVETQCATCTACTDAQVAVAPCTSQSNRKCVANLLSAAGISIPNSDHSSEEPHILSRNGDVIMRGAVDKRVYVQDLAVVSSEEGAAPVDVMQELQQLRAHLTELTAAVEEAKQH